MYKVEHTAHLLAQLMYREVLASSALGQIIMRQSPCPHDLRICVVIVTVLFYDPGVLNDRTKETFRDLICQFTLDPGDEIAFHSMHHDIRDACKEIIIRDSRKKFGIHNGEPAAVQIRTESLLFTVLLIRQDRVRGHFRTGCRDSQYAGDRKRFCDLDLLIPDIPERCVRMGSSVGNSLGGIDNAAAADAQDIIGTEFHGLTDTFLGMCQRRIGLDTAICHCCKTGILNRFCHTVQQSALHCAAAAIDYKYTAAAVRFDQASSLHLRGLAENNSCGCVLYKIIHILCLFSPDKTCSIVLFLYQRCP